ncbi:MAG: hypothetical protein RI563_05080 [Thiohalophilus sp.]|uniref:DUF748 domain-containing protein n=1 Tax=Thiohalophilus sp. TaxID=3028392 RepID=UPI0028705138|nr:hypothetical protein [Thiohalophilus sp.]MDR9436227.1 hypothetical protein [Thiohalophilus sp.]
MKKVTLGLVTLVVIAIIAGIIYVLTNLDSIVKAAIEKYGSQATQTTVQVDRVRIKLREGDGAIFGLTVANPKGFELPHAITLGETGLGIELKSVRAEPYVINHITVREPEVFFEVNADNKTNLNELKKNLAASQPSAKQDKPADKASAEPRLIIRRLTFEQGRVDAKVTPLEKNYELELPNINMTNLGGRQGATPTQLAREILQRLMDAAKEAVRRKGIDAELDKLKAGAKARVEEEKTRLKNETDSKLEEERKKAEDKLRRLLN